MSDTSVESAAKSLWWIFLVRGIITLAFGVVALFSPQIAGVIFAIIFAVWALADGILGVIQSVINGRAGQKWGWTLTIALVSIAAGIVVLVWPGATVVTIAAVLLWIIAIWLILLGILSFFAAHEVSGDGGSTVGPIVLGILSLVAGLLLATWIIVDIKAAATALVYIIGIYAVVAGLVLIVASFNFRKGRL